MAESERAEMLGALQAHVVVGLVDDELHRDELGEGDRRQLLRQRLHPPVELLEGVREVDQLDLGRLPAADPLARERVVLRLREAAR